MNSTKSEQINELAAALAKAQGQMKHASKDQTNPHFKSRYADLAGVIDACREALAANGLSVTQMPTTVPDAVVVTTMLMHSSGQWLSSDLTVPLSKRDAQGVGSALTYARRYALAATVGVAQDDDDGNAAASPKPSGRNRLHDDEPPQDSGPPDEPPPADEAPVAPPKAKAKPRSATAVLLDFKKRADSLNDLAALDKLMIAVGAEGMPERAKAIAIGYANVRKAEIQGGTASEADSTVASQLNDMAKE